MELLNPSVGIIFWTLLAFLIVFLLLSKFAWKPIIQSLKSREDFISNSLTKAKQVEESVKRVQADNEKLLKEALEEKKNLLKEAKNMYNEILAHAKEDAKKEAGRILDDALENVRQEQTKALEAVKLEVVDLVIEVTGKVLEEKLKDRKVSEALINKLVKEVNVN